MTKRFNPPSPRLSAVAVAAALAVFAGVTAAQPAARPAGQPGYVSNASGDLVKNGFGGCVTTGQAPAASGACPPMTTAAAPQAAGSASSTAAGSSAAARTSPAAAAGATGQSAAAGPGARFPGYAVSSDGNVVRSGFGACVRSGHWTPANAAEPCDRVARADVPPPPPPVAAAPEPKLEPAPAPAPVAAPEPPRPVIQKVTLSTDVLFDFNKSELKDSGKRKIDELLGQVKDASVDEIIAIGHADRIASEDYNQKLSEARAQAVRDYIASRGSNANRVTAQGKGESQPMTGEDCRKMGPERSNNAKLVACLQPDRRVEIEVLGTRQVAGGAPAAGTGATGTGASGSGSGATSR